MKKSTSFADVLKARKEQLHKLLGKPKLVDELGFVLGVFVMLFLLGMLLVHPNYFPHAYTALLAPLLVFRYLLYHREKHHYFMLDFCYYAQAQLLLFHWYYGPSAEKHFYAVYTLCSGPLAGAIVLWKCSLVLHDLDRFTSLYIHLVPPMVTYALRWYGPALGYPIPSFQEMCIPAMLLYVEWQFFYILKTEFFDRKVMRQDPNIMTSLRWQSQVKPHAIYRYVRETKNWNVPGIVILVTFQLFYTGIATFISYVVYRWQWINVAWLIFLLTTATWNGATFYFEAMIERERKEQARLDAQKEEEESKEKRKLLQVASTWRRLVTFLLFLLLWVVVDLYVLHPYIIMQ